MWQSIKGLAMGAVCIHSLFIFFFMGPFLALDYFINGFSIREASKIPFSYVNLRMP